MAIPVDPNQWQEGVLIPPSCGILNHKLLLLTGDPYPFLRWKLGLHLENLPKTPMNDKPMIS